MNNSFNFYYQNIISLSEWLIAYRGAIIAIVSCFYYLSFVCLHISFLLWNFNLQRFTSQLWFYRKNLRNRKKEKEKKFHVSHDRKLCPKALWKLVTSLITLSISLGKTVFTLCNCEVADLNLNAIELSSPNSRKHLFHSDVKCLRKAPFARDVIRVSRKFINKQFVDLWGTGLHVVDFVVYCRKSRESSHHSRAAPLP